MGGVTVGCEAGAGRPDRRLEGGSGGSRHVDLAVLREWATASDCSDGGGLPGPNEAGRSAKSRGMVVVGVARSRVGESGEVARLAVLSKGLKGEGGMLVSSGSRDGE